MELPGYHIDIDSAIERINQKKYTRIFLQIPEGLKTHFMKIIEKIEKDTNANVITYGDPCFGACDIPVCKIKQLDIDLIVHIGHVPIPELDEFNLPVIFLNAISKSDVLDVIEKAVPSFIGKNIGIVTNAQHLHEIKNIKRFLKDKGLNPIVGKGDNRIASNGQILGCNFSAAMSTMKKVDMFLFIGSGIFHPLGLMILTNKKVIGCDPYTKQVKIDELLEIKEMVLRQRYGAIARAKDCKKFGVLIGLKNGQQRMKLAYNIKDKLKKQKKVCFLIASDFFSPANLESFRDIDCFISTACPRIAIDDYMQYQKPILTPVELEILLGERKWEDYTIDQIRT